ncbi:MAG: HNH endonuclease [Deltaproteobacteria bacterium]|nr:HNH endonuclease [Deltaproteobacteria bacterium]MBW2363498.1 HNH endonuclease [Deltaproteobacteria bacterium]
MRTIYNPNEIIIKGNIAELVLYDTKGKERARAIIDAEDTEKVKGFKWCLCSRKGKIDCVQTKRDRSHETISNVIMGFKSSKERMIDHKDRNPLNNRKSNLRVCIRAENNRNTGLSKNNTSGFKGVFWLKDIKQWMVRITANKKPIYLGCFKDRTEAAIVYNKAALKYHGEFASLNQI